MDRQQTRYILTKVKAAYASGTLKKRMGLVLGALARRPYEAALCGYRLSNADWSLNTRDGFADHRTNPNHLRSNPEHLRRIIAAYKAAKQAQGKAAPEFRLRGLWDEWITANYAQLRPAIEQENLQELARLLENLHRESFTGNMGGYDHFLLYRSFLGSILFKYLWAKYRFPGPKGRWPKQSSKQPLEKDSHASVSRST